MLQFWPTQTDGVHLVIIDRPSADAPATVRLVGVLWI
jgi:hypothetical protein